MNQITTWFSRLSPWEWLALAALVFFVLKMIFSRRDAPQENVVHTPARGMGLTGMLVGLLVLIMVVGMFIPGGWYGLAQRMGQ